MSPPSARLRTLAAELLEAAAGRLIGETLDRWFEAKSSILTTSDPPDSSNHQEPFPSGVPSPSVSTVHRLTDASLLYTATSGISDTDPVPDGSVTEALPAASDTPDRTVRVTSRIGGSVLPALSQAAIPSRMRTSHSKRIMPPPRGNQVGTTVSQRRICPPVRVTRPIYGPCPMGTEMDLCRKWTARRGAGPCCFSPERHAAFGACGFVSAGASLRSRHGIPTTTL